MSGPYRMVGTITPMRGGGEAVWTPSGEEMGDAAVRPAAVPPFLVLEAMAQTAGLVLNAAHGERWLLAGIDGADVGTPSWDSPTTLRCTEGERRGRFAHVRVEADHGTGGTSTAGLLMAVLDRRSDTA